MADVTWGHWCYDQQPVHLPVDQPRCPQCGALNLNRTDPKESPDV